MVNTPVPVDWVIVNTPTEMREFFFSTIPKMESYTFHKSQLPKLEAGFANMLANLVNYRDNVLPLHINLKIAHATEHCHMIAQYLKTCNKYDELPWWRKLFSRRPMIPTLQHDNIELVLGVDHAISRLVDKLIHITHSETCESQYYHLISTTDDTIEHAIINGKYTNFTVADIIKRL